MICTQLQTYWEMVMAMRRHPDPELQQCGTRWLKAKATTLSGNRIENRAIGIAMRGLSPIKSKLRT